MKNYKGKPNWLLSTLHLIGFITLPNFFSEDWKNKLHNLFIKRILVPITLQIACLQLASTFIYAIHDLTEFLQRLLESILVLLFVGEALHFSACIDQVLELFDLQDRVFTITDKDIYKKYDRVQDWQVKFNIVCNVLTVLGLCLETLLPMSERTLYLMTSIYKKNHPSRILPFHVWTAGFIDVTENGVFQVVYILEFFALVAFCMTIFSFSLQMYLVTPLVGQYKMFAKFVSKIGAEHRDSCGQSIVYTDVSTGTYLTDSELSEYWNKKANKTENVNKQLHEIPEIQQQNSKLKCRMWIDKEYQLYYVKQIISRHQRLNNFKNQYWILMKKFMEPMFVLFLTIMCLSFYQTAYNMKYLPWFSCLNIVVQLAFTIVGMWQVTELSEALNHCNEVVEKAVYQSKWYKSDPKVKQCVWMMLRETQQEQYLRLLHGYFILTNEYMVKVFKGALSFINFMKISGPL